MARSHGQERRCEGCGTRMARDNRSRLCSPCSRHQVQASNAPVQPDSFWQCAALQEALCARHFGLVIYAYRTSIGRCSPSPRSVAGSACPKLR